MIRVAIVGYGNIGKYAAAAVNSEPDMELAGIVRRNVEVALPELTGVPVVQDIDELGGVDVAILCTPSRSVPIYAKKMLSLGINTVDSYDIHSSISDLRAELNMAAEEGGATAIIAAGWDPGSDSVVRALLEACAPKGITYTNFGPGMSMGHSVAAKAIPGVKDALSMTIPTGTGIHRRMLYVVLEAGSELETVTAQIKRDPYFSHDETIVSAVSDLSSILDMGHGVNMVRKGVSGATHNQCFEFNMKINNPALTSQIMISASRASLKQEPGAYTLIEIPLIDLLAGDRDEIIRRLV